MTSWLIEQTLLITLMVSLLLLSGNWLTKTMGASSHYGLWLIIPTGLIINSIDFSFWVNHGSITKFIVSAKSQANDLLIPELGVSEFLTVTWVVGLLLITSYTLYLYVDSVKKIKAQLLEKAEQPSFSHQLTNKKLRLKFTKEETSPYLIGAFFPTLIVPVNFQQLFTPEQQRLILAHEQVHVYRNDILWNHLAVVLLLLFWFNPLCWLAYRKFRILQELSCDQIVLQSSNKRTRVEYAKALLNASSHHPIFNLSQLTFGEKSMLKERLNQLKTNTCSSIVSKSLVALSIVLSGAVLTVANANIPKASDEVKPIVRINPKYPIEAVEKGIEGFVKMSFEVNPQGKVSNIQVLSSNPKGIFDESAKRAVSRWKYANPAGETIDSEVQLDFLLGPNTVEKISIIAKDNSEG